MLNIEEMFNKNLDCTSDVSNNQLVECQICNLTISKDQMQIHFIENIITHCNFLSNQINQISNRVRELESENQALRQELNNISDRTNTLEQTIRTLTEQREIRIPQTEFQASNPSFFKDDSSNDSSPF